MNRNILVLYEDGYYDVALEFLPKSLLEGFGLEVRESNADISDLSKFTDIICIGFSFSPEYIEELWKLSLHILTIDDYYDDHPLIPLNVEKDNMPFLDYRGKWAILLADRSWYKQTIRNLIHET